MVMAEPEPETEVVELSVREMEVLREVFDNFDEDGGGSIDQEELGKAMKALGSEVSQTELEVRHTPGSYCPATRMRYNVGPKDH